MKEKVSSKYEITEFLTSLQGNNHRFDMFGLLKKLGKENMKNILDKTDDFLQLKEEMESKSFREKEAFSQWEEQFGERFRNQVDELKKFIDEKARSEKLELLKKDSDYYLGQYEINFENGDISLQNQYELNDQIKSARENLEKRKRQVETIQNTFLKRGLKTAKEELEKAKEKLEKLENAKKELKNIEQELQTYVDSLISTTREYRESLNLRNKASIRDLMYWISKGEKLSEKEKRGKERYQQLKDFFDKLKTKLSQ